MPPTGPAGGTAVAFHTWLPATMTMAAVLAATVGLAGCEQKIEQAPNIRPVRTVTVDKRTTNTVGISNIGGGAVEVEWNGGADHSFTGVATIVVDTRNARTDVVALDDVTH